MSDKPVKLIILIPRNKNLSRDEFKNHYENVHTKYAVNVKGVQRNVRRYVLPFERPGEAKVPNVSFDVIDEITFKNRADLDKALQGVKDQPSSAEMIRDEEYNFDRKKIEYYILEEECDLQPEFLNLK